MWFGLGLVMRRFIVAALSAALSLAFASAATRAQAEIRVEVSRVSQTMDVIVDGEHAYTWRVSTGRSGWATPPGTFHPQFMAARWFSRVFNNAPMPHSIFYSGPFAIHGTVDVARLGRQPRTAASGLRQPMRRCCSGWCRNRACATPPSWCSSAGLPREAKDEK